MINKIALNYTVERMSIGVMETYYPYPMSILLR